MEAWTIKLELAFRRWQYERLLAKPMPEDYPKIIRRGIELKWLREEIDMLLWFLKQERENKEL